VLRTRFYLIRSQLNLGARQQRGYMHVRRATADDADTLAALLAVYLRESYPGHLGSSPGQLRRDVLGEHSLHHVLLAATQDNVVGFVAWDLVYDMHWATSGTQIADSSSSRPIGGLGSASHSSQALPLMCWRAAVPSSVAARLIARALVARMVVWL
jgi:hypothetical protein